MLDFILAAEAVAEGTETAANSGSKNSWVIWVIMGVFLVVMVLFTVIPQRKRQKQQQNMMNSLTVGTKLMTVGGLIGTIAQVNTDNTLIINVGTESNPTLMVIDRKAVGYVLENAAAPQAEPAVEDAPQEESVQEDAPQVDDALALDESVFEMEEPQAAEAADVPEDVE